MKPISTKALAFASALVLGTAISSGSAIAQTETVNAQLITSSAITTVDVSDMDFGTYLIQFTAGDTPVLNLTNDGSVLVTQVGSVANGSQVVQITAPATEGVVTVDVPAPASLTMTASAFTDIVDAGLTLDVATFRTASENGSVITGGAVDAADTITVVTGGGTPETVTFGGQIDISATPADATHTAQFDVTFSY
ncbi:MAG: hypothetical protein R3E13_08830 [Alphaproteobacteria bacterium]